MSIGKLRNRKCSCGSGKKLKKCCWDKDYWDGFSKSVSEITIKEKLHGKPIEYTKEVIRYYKRPTI